MYCYSLSQCFYQDLSWNLLILAITIPFLALLIWRKEIKEIKEEFNKFNKKKKEIF